MYFAEYINTLQLKKKPWSTSDHRLLKLLQVNLKGRQADRQTGRQVGRQAFSQIKVQIIFHFLPCSCEPV